MARKLLSVRDLKTSFFTHVGEVKAVRVRLLSALCFSLTCALKANIYRRKHCAAEYIHKESVIAVKFVHICQYAVVARLFRTSASR